MTNSNYRVFFNSLKGVFAIQTPRNNDAYSTVAFARHLDLYKVKPVIDEKLLAVQTKTGNKKIYAYLECGNVTIDNRSQPPINAGIEVKLDSYNWVLLSPETMEWDNWESGAGHVRLDVFRGKPRISIQDSVI